MTQVLYGRALSNACRYIQESWNMTSKLGAVWMAWKVIYIPECRPRQCLVCRDWLVSGGALSVGQYQRLYWNRGRLQQHTAVQRVFGNCLEKDYTSAAVVKPYCGKSILVREHQCRRWGEQRTWMFVAPSSPWFVSRLYRVTEIGL